MGFIFIFIFILAAVWYWAIYDILLRIERTHYRRNWEKDTQDITWFHTSEVARSLRRERTYLALANSWFFSTPAWARDHKIAYRLMWCWRLGYIVIILVLVGMFFGPLLKDMLL